MAESEEELKSLLMKVNLTFRKLDHGIWSHHFKNFPQFVVIYIVKDFSVVNEAEVDVFLEFSSVTHWMLAILSLIPLPFLNPACISGSSWFIYC